MRIRRRPQALTPSPMHQASDPSAATFQSPPPPVNQQHWLPQKEEVGEKKSGELHSYSNVDLGDEPSRSTLPSQPQGNNVVGRSSENPRGGDAQRHAGAVAADGHGSLENGDRDGCGQWALINAGEEEEEGLVNGVFETMPLASMSPLSMKEGIKTDSPKRQRGPSVLMEGSRCSRMNGRGWRCSQPTLVGYSLCEHHLGKGRRSRANSGSAGRNACVSKLGRTEPGGKKSVALLALAAAAANGNQPAAHLAAEFS